MLTHDLLLSCCCGEALAGVLGVGGPAAAAGAGLLLEGAAGPLKVGAALLQLMGTS
jgi:hypothetical protein